MKVAPAPREKRQPRQGAIFPIQLLAANVRAGRALLKLSQQDLAERMSALDHQWSRPTVSQVERETRSVSVDELFGLAHALDTDILTLLSPHEGFRVTIDTGLPTCLSPAAVRGMLTHQRTDMPAFHWTDNEPIHVRTLTAKDAREEGIDLDY
jgi:transcriptional regulator with XRE-family HTH domain